MKKFLRMRIRSGRRKYVRALLEIVRIKYLGENEKAVKSF